ncbi:MAG: D-aminoacyl-tRNA deacylase [Candidatus Bathyarchaeia archaeon]
MTFDPDPASRTMRDLLISAYGFKRSSESFEGSYVFERDAVSLATLKVESINAEGLERHFRTKLFIFLSKHESISKTPALLTHVPGNWGDEIKYGGLPRKICVAPASALRAALLTLKRIVDERELGYIYGLEVTHHGPYVETTPSMFVELGSDASRWTDEKAAEACVLAALEATRARTVEDVFIGLGGGHYAPAFTRFVLNSNSSVSHIIPRHTLRNAGAEDVLMALERSLERPKGALLDWNGVDKEDRVRLIQTLQGLKVHHRKI